MPSAFIDDGYSLRATIKSEAGTFDEFDIVYRPMEAGESAELLAKTDKMPWGTYSQVRAEWVAKKLISWTLIRSNNSPVEITPKTVLKLLDEALHVVWKHVSGELPGVEEPSKN